MSYTELYKVGQSGDVELHREYQNSWRGAILIWQAMAKRYLPMDFGLMMARQDLQPLWDLAKDQQVPLAHRITLASTFDRVMVKHEDFPRLIAAWEQFGRDFGDSGHLLAQIVTLRELASDPNCQAVCWNQTSVSDSPWYVQDCDTEEYCPYNITRNTNHWFLFDREYMQQ